MNEKVQNLFLHLKYPKQKQVAKAFYSVFHRFREAKFAYGGLI
jgi:hypothetical protein